MDALTREAIALTRIQASTRSMSAEEMESMIRSVTVGLHSITSQPVEKVAPPEVDWRKSIRAKSITCLECGERFKILTKKHLAKHDLEPAEYRATYSMPKGAPLTCKELSRARKETMQRTRLWERKATKEA